MSDSRHADENKDHSLARKVSKKANKKNTRRETKIHLENFKYSLDSDEVYDIMDDMED
mgnify:CR=1 FL=1